MKTEIKTITINGVEYIAASHSAIPALLGYVSEIERKLGVAKSALEWYANGMPWNDKFGNETECARQALKEIGEA